MTLYESISARRQVRKFDETPLDRQTLDKILIFVLETAQFSGQHAEFEIASAEAVIGGGSAPHYLLSYCESTYAAYANVGYVLQNADLYIQSIGLGSGWFIGPKPKGSKTNHCIALAFGGTDVPMRKSTDEFKRKLVNEISPIDDAISQAVRLAPSAMNSQPWKLSFEDGKVFVMDCGHGVKRVMLRNKPNKIDIGIAVRHAVIALEHEGKTVTDIIPYASAKDFEVEILYT